MDTIFIQTEIVSITAASTFILPTTDQIQTKFGGPCSVLLVNFPYILIYNCDAHLKVSILFVKTFWIFMPSMSHWWQSVWRAHRRLCALPLKEEGCDFVTQGAQGPFKKKKKKNGSN